MLFRCLKFAVGGKESNTAMAKSLFKLEQPLGMVFFSLSLSLPNLNDLSNCMMFE